MTASITKVVEKPGSVPPLKTTDDTRKTVVLGLVSGIKRQPTVETDDEKYDELPAKKAKTSPAKLATVPEKKPKAPTTSTGRPRGRPRKDASATAIFKPAPPPKKKRGRPKIKPSAIEITTQPQPAPPYKPANHFGIPGQPFVPPSGDDIAILRNQFIHMEKYQKQKAAEEAAAKLNEGNLQNLVTGTFMQNGGGFFVPAPGYEPFLSGYNGISSEAFLESWKTGESPVAIERRFGEFRKRAFGFGGVGGVEEKSIFASGSNDRGGESRSIFFSEEEDRAIGFPRTTGQKGPRQEGANAFNHPPLFGNTRKSPGPLTVCPAWVTKAPAGHFGNTGNSSSTVPGTAKTRNSFGAYTGDANGGASGFSFGGRS